MWERFTIYKAYHINIYSKYNSLNTIIYHKKQPSREHSILYSGKDLRLNIFLANLGSKVISMLVWRGVGGGGADLHWINPNFPAYCIRHSSSCIAMRVGIFKLPIHPPARSPPVRPPAWPPDSPPASSPARPADRPSASSPARPSVRLPASSPARPSVRPLCPPLPLRPDSRPTSTHVSATQIFWLKWWVGSKAGQASFFCVTASTGKGIQVEELLPILVSPSSVSFNPRTAAGAA